MDVYEKVKDFHFGVRKSKFQSDFFVNPVYYLRISCIYELKKLKSVLNQSAIDIYTRQFGANSTRLPLTENPTSNLSTLY